MWMYEVTGLAVAKGLSLAFLVGADHRNRKRQWWSHSFTVGVALLILLVPVNLVKWVFAVSIAGGLAQASQTVFC